MGRPSYTDQQVQEGRRQLGEAALRLYRAKGYEAVTLRSLASEVGISSATPYRFFASKEAVFEYVRAIVYTEFGDYLDAADPGAGDPLERLRRIATAMVDYGLKRPDDYRLIFSMRQAPISADSPLHVARQRTLDRAIAICQQVIDSGRLVGDARVLLHVAWVAMHGLLSFHVSNQLTHGVGIEELIGPMLDRLVSPVPATAAPATPARAPRRRPTRPKR
jgi:AcrR family transcriptional regulator